MLGGDAAEAEGGAALVEGGVALLVPLHLEYSIIFIKLINYLIIKNFTLKGHGLARILHLTSTSLSPSLTSRRCGSVMSGS